MARTSDVAKGSVVPRREWLRVLAQSDAQQLQQAMDDLAQPELDLLRPPEIGLVMVRGRMGGVGRRFNVGEATVTRCAVTDGRIVGHGYVLGRDKGKALAVARCDAMLQMPQHAELVAQRVLAPFRAALEAKRMTARRRAAATRVDFFTLVRGED